ncbi:MAG: hypothetical protein IJK46_01600 [Prevotella sp.]|nr:hypothetical protein [Prevotella sp.]
MKQKKQKKETPRFKGVAKSGLYNAIVWAAGLAIIAFALLFFESNFLWKAQELNLFQHTSLFFKQQMVVPGGMLTYLGTFLTEFFYYPWLGVLILIGCWLLVMWLTKRAFSIPGKWALLMFVPVVLLLLTIVDLGYWIYLLKLRGHFFVATLGTLFVVFMLWIFRSLPRKYHLRAVFLVFTAVVGYPLAGIYGLAATLLMAILSWRIETKTWSVVYSLLAVLTVVAVPLFCYRYLYYEINQANIYWAELPLFFIQEEYHQYYIPYYLLALFYVILAVTYRQDWKTETAKPIRWLLAQAALLAILVVGTYKGWFKDENFHHELAMQHCVEHLDWEGVLSEASRQHDEPTRSIVMMKNLALARLGRQGNEMYAYKNGSKEYNAPFKFRLLMVIGPMIYYQYGMTNYSMRYSTEMGVEFEWRAEYFKNLSRCALLNGEWQVARKYINQLKQTTFHRKWAAEMEQLIGHPEKIAENREMAPITHMMHYENRLFSDGGYVERAIMTHLAALREVDDPYFQEQALLASMWSLNPQIFWYHFSRYVKMHPKQAIPVHYQEAAYLYGVLADNPNVDKFPIDASVKEKYSRFDQTMAQYDGKDIKEVQEATEQLFGDTFFYQYYLMSNLPEY